MKALIISDIHSNILGLEAILKIEQDYDVIYCAGDLVDIGLHPKEVIHLIRENNVICVKGNHDELVIRIFRSGINLQDIPREQLDMPHDNARKLDEEEITYLESLPDRIQFNLDGIGYSLQHTYHDYEIIDHLPQYMGFWEKSTTEPIRNATKKRFIFGHTHRRGIYYLSEDCLWMNPGSVSYTRPNDGTKGAYYITITDGIIELKHVDYEGSMTRIEMGEHWNKLFR